MTTRSLIMLMVAGTLLSACDSGATDDALVGGWVRMRTATEMRDRYRFGADGSFAFDENKPDDPQTEDHLTGTYVARNGVVTATATNTLVPHLARLTFSYYANATQFSSAALRPTAEHDGIVGTWNGLRKLELLDSAGQNPSGEAIAAEFRSDGTCRLTITPFDGTAATVDDGTWVTQTNGTFHATGRITEYTFILLDDEALVDAPRIWQRN
jgi:hypothetical protein